MWSKLAVFVDFRAETNLASMTGAGPGYTGPDDWLANGKKEGIEETTSMIGIGPVISSHLPSIARTSDLRSG
jgi:hypothetical protein